MLGVFLGIKEETESSDVIGERALETMNESVILVCRFVDLILQHENLLEYSI